MKIGKASHNQFKKMNAPPDDEAAGKWIWFTLEMLSAPAWRELTASARRVLDRVIIEHLAQGITANGDLIVKFDDFQAYGMDRHTISSGIAVAVALGFLAITEKGHSGYGVARRANKFRLTWLPQYDGSACTNDWKRHKSGEDAKGAIEHALKEIERLKRLRATRKGRKKSPVDKTTLNSVGKTTLVQWVKPHRSERFAGLSLVGVSTPPLDILPVGAGNGSASPLTAPKKARLSAPPRGAEARPRASSTKKLSPSSSSAPRKRVSKRASKRRVLSSRPRRKGANHHVR